MRIVPVGEEFSLAEVIRTLPADVDHVLLYEGDEPSVDALEVLAGVGDGWCVALADMTETVKIVDDSGLIAGTLDRETVLRVRSPQAATRAALLAVTDADFSFAAMPSRAAALGIPVTTVR